MGLLLDIKQDAQLTKRYYGVSSLWEVLKFSSFMILVSYRIRRTVSHKIPFVHSVLQTIERIVWGIEISPLAQLDSVIFLHSVGIVIGPSVVGYGTVFSGGNTLGSRYRPRTRDVAVIPKIGKNVQIGCGAKILGSITVGNNVQIGANAVVITNIPNNRIAVGVPAKHRAL